MRTVCVHIWPQKPDVHRHSASTSEPSITIQTADNRRSSCSDEAGQSKHLTTNITSLYPERCLSWIRYNFFRPDVNKCLKILPTLWICNYLLLQIGLAQKDTDCILKTNDCTALFRETVSPSTAPRLKMILMLHVEKWTRALDPSRREFHARYRR